MYCLNLLMLLARYVLLENVWFIVHVSGVIVWNQSTSLNWMLEIPDPFGL